MKKMIALSLLLAFGSVSFSQQNIQKLKMTQENYLQKSKKQKKMGWILISAGAASFIVSAVIPKGELTGEIGWPCLCQDVHQNDNVKAAFGLAGAVSAIASIPFFIVSGKNKRKARAASVFIDTQQHFIVETQLIRNQSFPIVGIKLSL
jgi:hypothetical protein